MLVTPPDSPLGQPQPKPGGECFAPYGITILTWCGHNLGHPCVAWKGAKHSPKSEIMRKSTSYNQILETFICIEIYAECNETTPVISFNRFHGESHISMKIVIHMPYKMIHALSNSFTELLSRNIILIHTYVIVMFKQCWTSSHASSPKSINTMYEYRVR